MPYLKRLMIIFYFEMEIVEFLWCSLGGEMGGKVGDVYSRYSRINDVR